MQPARSQIETLNGAFRSVRIRWCSRFVRTIFRSALKFSRRVHFFQLHLKKKFWNDRRMMPTQPPVSSSFSKICWVLLLINFCYQIFHWNSFRFWNSKSSPIIGPSTVRWYCYLEILTIKAQLISLKTFRLKSSKSNRTRIGWIRMPLSSRLSVNTRSRSCCATAVWLTFFLISFWFPKMINRNLFTLNKHYETAPPKRLNFCSLCV